MAPTRYDFFLAPLKNGDWRRSAAVGLYHPDDENELQGPTTLNTTHRFDGSLTRQASTISLKAREYLYWPPTRSRVGGAPCTLANNKQYKKFTSNNEEILRF
jgi:hypothetical protein